MAVSQQRKPAGAAVSQRPPARRRARLGTGGAPRSRLGYGFVAGYAVLLLLFGLLPTLYAIWLAISNSNGQLVGLGNFTAVMSDYRFVPAFENVAVYLAIWLVVLVVAVVVLSLMLHGRLRRASSVSRFIFYLPGALAGAASALVWMFMLDPSVSPVAWLLHDLGYSTFANVIAPQRLPVVFAVMAFWTGAGGWIVVMYGALNNIPDELLEAARIDGASALKTAWYVQIPLLRKWIAYMLILAFATGTQLFVEPQLVGEASLGQVSDSWSPNQLAYQYAFRNNNFNDASAVSIYLLILGLACAALIVFRSGLFEVNQ
jgi:multiple sugar transport system permease protein